jgi:LemA protein
MSKTLKTVLIIAGILVLIVLVPVTYLKGTYNTLVTMDEGVKAAWAQVENQLQRRYDLIPNYVETVKGYAAHEKEVFVKVTEARSRVAGAKSIEALKIELQSNAGDLTKPSRY